MVWCTFPNSTFPNSLFKRHPQVDRKCLPQQGVQRASFRVPAGRVKRQSLVKLLRFLELKKKDIASETAQVFSLVANSKCFGELRRGSSLGEK